MEDSGSKYSVGDKVVVSGSLTGLGDIKATIVEVEYDEISKQYFYTIRTTAGYQQRAQERFISKPRNETN